MKYIKKLWPSIIISWVLFGLGIVGTILIVTQSQKQNLLPMMESHIVGDYTFKLFGIEPYRAVGTLVSDEYKLSVTQSDYYDYFPFAVGLGLVLLYLLVTVILYKSKKREKEHE